MNIFAELLLNTLAGGLETIGESKLVDVLQKLHDTNPTQYKAAIEGGHALVTSLTPIAAGTSTKIDDAILGAFSDAITASAAANGFSLASQATESTAGGQTV